MSVRKTRAQHEKLAKLLEEGTPVCAALEQAGWSKQQAQKGHRKVPLAVYGLLSKKARRLIELGKTGKEDRKNLIRGRLVDNITRGMDGGAMSAKILGSDSELNLWTPDLQQGLIILNAPPTPTGSRLDDVPEE